MLSADETPNNCCKISGLTEFPMYTRQSSPFSKRKTPSSFMCSLDSGKGGGIIESLVSCKLKDQDNFKHHSAKTVSLRINMNLIHNCLWRESMDRKHSRINKWNCKRSWEEGNTTDPVGSFIYSAINTQPCTFYQCWKEQRISYVTWLFTWRKLDR